MSNIFSENLGEWRSTVGDLAVLVTFLQFLSGSIICIRYMKTQSTGDTSGFSFVCGFLSCNLWLKYGLLKHDDLVILINSSGVFLFSVYTFVYFRYVTFKKIVVTQFLFVAAFLFLFYAYIAFETSPLVALKTTGLVSCIVTLIFIASPLTMLLHVIRVRSTESLPFPIILTSFFVSSLWFVYGSIIEDTFMEFPNALGAVLSAFQLSLFFFCPSKGSALPQYSKLRQVA